MIFELNNFEKISLNIKIQIILVFLIGFILVGGIFNNFVNLLLLKEGYSKSYIGTLNGFALISIAIGAILSAFLSTKIQKINIYRLGFIFFSIFVVIFPFSSIFDINHIYLINYSFIHIFAGMIFSLGGPFIMENSNVDNQDESFALLFTSIPMGGLLGSLFGSFIFNYLSNNIFKNENIVEIYKISLCFGSLFSIFGCISLFFFKNYKIDDEKIDDEKIDDEKHNLEFPFKLFFLIIIIIYLRITAIIIARTFTNIYLDEIFSVESDTIALIFAVSSIFAIPSTLFAPKLIRIFNRYSVFNASVFITALFLFLSVIYLNWIWTSICFVIIISASQISSPVFTSIIMNSVKIKWRLIISSGTVIAVGISGFFTNYLGGILLENYGYLYFYIIGSITTILGLLLFKLSESSFK